MAEQLDPFAAQRRLIWRVYPDPIWHLRGLPAFACQPDRHAALRNTSLRRLPVPTSLRGRIEALWRREQELLTRAALAGTRAALPVADPSATRSSPTAKAQQRIAREGYVLSWFGAGAIVGEAIDGQRGSMIGAVALGTLGLYRSRHSDD